MSNIIEDIKKIENLENNVEMLMGKIKCLTNNDNNTVLTTASTTASTSLNNISNLSANTVSSNYTLAYGT